MARKTKEETKVQNQIRAELGFHGLTIRHNVGLFRSLDDPKRLVKVGMNGMCDLQFIGDDGTVAWIEVKFNSGKPSDEQLKFIEEMNARGIKAGIVRSVDEALELVGVKKK